MDNAGSSRPWEHRVALPSEWAGWDLAGKAPAPRPAQLAPAFAGASLLNQRAALAFRPSSVWGQRSTRLL
jgi:hypothetical protein